MFALSKIIWAWASPGSLLAFMLAAGLFMARRLSASTRKIGNVICLFVSACLLALALLPVGEWALTPLENNFKFSPPDQVDGIIVLGGDEQTEISEKRDLPTALDSMRRYWMFNKLARRYPGAKLVFSGGSALIKPQARLLDSSVAREIMGDMGLTTNRLTIEHMSRNTYENAVFSANAVHPEPSQNWLLVTSAWHMTRAMGCFREAGWNVFAAPTGYFTTGDYRLRLLFHFDEQLRLLTMAVHEYVGLAVYRIMERTNALWPK